MRRRTSVCSVYFDCVRLSSIAPYTFLQFPKGIGLLPPGKVPDKYVQDDDDDIGENRPNKRAATSSASRSSMGTPRWCDSMSAADREKGDVLLTRAMHRKGDVAYNVRQSPLERLAEAYPPVVPIPIGGHHRRQADGRRVPGGAAGRPPRHQPVPYNVLDARRGDQQGREADPQPHGVRAHGVLLDAFQDRA